MRKSPFKFLDAYEQEDKEAFYGRTQETEKLYNLVFRSNLVLLFGKSGTGKTSLIKCGLANRVKSNSWYPIYIRREDDINDALIKELHLHIDEGEIEKFRFSSLAEKLWAIYRRHLKRIYLILDQFEEIFIDNPREVEEATNFFISMNQLMKDCEAPFKFIIAMREEFLANLVPYEKQVISLLDNRMRLEPMEEEMAWDVVRKSFEYYNDEEYFNKIAQSKGKMKRHYKELILKNPEKTAIAIVDNIKQNNTVDLPYLQIYLDALFEAGLKKAGKKSAKLPNVVFEITREGKGGSYYEINEVGDLTQVLPGFIDKIIKELHKEFEKKDKALVDERKQIPILVLYYLVSGNRTKLSLTEEQIFDKLSYRKIDKEDVKICLDKFEEMKILRTT